MSAHQIALERGEMIGHSLKLGVPTLEKTGVHSLCDLVDVISNAPKLGKDDSAIRRIEENADWLPFEARTLAPGVQIQRGLRPRPHLRLNLVFRHNPELRRAIKIRKGHCLGAGSASEFIAS
jgi:hypothetical protein